MPTFRFPPLPEHLELPVDAGAVTSVARDSVYVAVGTGVLAFQRAQVARRDLQSRLGEVDVDPREWANTVVTNGRDRLETLREKAGRLGEVPAVHAIDEQLQVVEDRVDSVLDAVETKLPTPAQFALNTVREVAKDSGAQARTFLGLGA